MAFPYLRSNYGIPVLDGELSETVFHQMRGCVKKEGERQYTTHREERSSPQERAAQQTGDSVHTKDRQRANPRRETQNRVGGKEKKELRDYQILLTTSRFCQEPRNKNPKTAGLTQSRGERKLKRRNHPTLLFQHCLHGGAGGTAYEQ